MKYFKYFGIALMVILLDQAVKMLVHFNMEYGAAGVIHIFGDWFKLLYTRNPGMAFGLELGSSYGKLILTSFRLVAMGAISYYLYLLIKRNTHPGFLVCLSLILGGAIGNVVDSVFYGVFLNLEAPGSPTKWFHGQVIDMFYLDIWEGILPEWIPFFGGNFYSLWPIFNVADAAIFVGITVAIIFQNRFATDEPDAQEEQKVVA